MQCHVCVHRPMCCATLKNGKPPSPNPYISEMAFFLQISKTIHIPPPPGDDMFAHGSKSCRNCRKVPKPRKLAYYECPQEICPRVTGIWSAPQTSVHCLTCCTAAYLRRGPNVALSSPWLAAMECFLACPGQLFSLSLSRLGVPCKDHPPISQYQKDKSNGFVADRPGLKPAFCGVCTSGMLHRPHLCNHFLNHPLAEPLRHTGAQTTYQFVSCAGYRRQSRPHRLHGRWAWPPTRRAL